ncbi:MbcA/ParS/Xre antitoxin family protein [Pseudomonas sp. Irchel 3E19]|uniref:MbcA/ParS/Xre antitoxin family protein n=1 Tax=Pseudomonas sp. Irchel 3E19 TaxID=2008981 RepID=UPI000BA3FB77|nr:MbcA/ParS/Xre antitoxin family protein [Pseudomonas sp. Irchel 3E19]
MAYRIAHTAVSKPLVRKPTEYLTHVGIQELNELNIFLLAKEGFAVKDAEAMVSLSELYLSFRVIERIVGKPGRPKKGKGDEFDTDRLSVLQSAIAFQYAKVLEDAMSVFGTLRLAEEWLAKPCRHLAGNIPLDLVSNPLGFQVVENYLERLELGVYQ